MKLTRKQFLAALTILTTLPARLVALAARSSTGLPKLPDQPDALLRDGPWLADWRQAHWMPVYESVHPTAQRLILAAWRGEMLLVRYWGGCTPGQERRISPELVFQLDGCGPLYVSGYCHLRRAKRVFNVGRMELQANDDTSICITE